jgi:hypothetical protein
LTAQRQCVFRHADVDRPMVFCLRSVPSRTATKAAPAAPGAALGRGAACVLGGIAVQTRLKERRDPCAGFGPAGRLADRSSSGQLVASFCFERPHAVLRSHSCAAGCFFFALLAVRVDGADLPSVSSQCNSC